MAIKQVVEQAILVGVCVDMVICYIQDMSRVTGEEIDEGYNTNIVTDEGRS